MNSKNVKNIREPLKKPRPLKSVSIDQSKDSPSLSAKAQTDLLRELETVCAEITNYESINVAANIKRVCALLKEHGEELDSMNKDAMDHLFSNLRNLSREDRLGEESRLRLLEVIEMRSSKWSLENYSKNYYNARLCELEEINERRFTLGNISPNILGTHNQNHQSVVGLFLSHGEVLRSSGKFDKPTKISGKNYYKDEIVIRNSDSGKVSAGAQDRLVQITGPDENAISNAKYYIEDTIKRNVSPVRDNLNNPDLAVMDNKNHISYVPSPFDRSNPGKRSLYHSYSMSDASSRDSTLSVHVGNEEIILSGARLELLTKAQSVLTDFFARHLDNSDKEPSNFSPRTTSIGDNQRFTLKKQASMKDNLPSSFSSSIDHGFSRQSSSMSSSSDDILPDEESSDLEAMSPSAAPAFIPPPTYSTYTRDILLECARLPLSQKQPDDLPIIAANFPELVAENPVMFDPSPLLQKKNSS